MILPHMRYQSKMHKLEQFQFSGINRNKASGDGSVFDLLNVRTDDFPLLTSAKKRKRIKTYEDAWYYGIEDKEVVIQGKINPDRVVPSWQSGSTYEVEAIVAHKNRIYKCIKKVYGTNSEGKVAPAVNTDYWAVYLDGTSFSFEGELTAKAEPSINSVWHYGERFYRNISGQISLNEGALVPPNEDSVNWEEYSYAKLVYDGKEVEGLELLPSGGKETAMLNGVLVILPDLYYYDSLNDEFGSLKGKTFRADNTQGFYYNKRFFNYKLRMFLENGNDSSKNVLRLYWITTNNNLSEFNSKYTNFTLLDYFKPGDIVTIQQTSKSYATLVNGDYALMEVTEDSLVFEDGAFSASDIDDEHDNWSDVASKPAWRLDGVTLSTGIPELEHICVSGNRMWGCSGDEIRATYLGDALGWNKFDGTDAAAWVTDTGTVGEFTACFEYGGMPLFFKENSIYAINGKYTSYYAAQKIADIGCRKDSHKSVANVNSILMWLSNDGVCAYTGGVPAIISTPLQCRLSDAISATDGYIFYISAYDGNMRRLFTYDTRYNAWSSQTMDFKPLGFDRDFDSLNYMDANGDVVALSEFCEVEGEETELDTSVIEFGDIYEATMNSKDVGRVIIRASVNPMYGGMNASVMYDSDGVWHKVGRIYNQTNTKKVTHFGFFPRRCDHWRLKLECRGEFTLYGVGRQVRT